MDTSNCTTAVSAPGKVFLAGGYLVLDRKHTGLIFGLDARIHVLIRSSHAQQDVVVESPQFHDAVWRYRMSADSQKIHQVAGDSNPFVGTALGYALSFVNTWQEHPLQAPIHITILADNDYYSQPAIDSSKPSTRFRNFDKPINQVNKTGLGSSAALVTALVGAVLVHFGYPIQRANTTQAVDYKILHRLAQAAHCAAQGKVGSGFDVASAVFGSCVYRRFSPSLLQDLGTMDDQDFGKRLTRLILADDLWDDEVNAKRKVKIPSALRLVMCDVDCGSQTPGMVKQVLNWRAKNPEEANALWSELQLRNEELADEFVRLSDTEGHGDYNGLRTCFRQIRKLLKDMSIAADVPIEPDSQTKLLDACTNIQGVIGGVVPGAGGYDAITLLIEEKDEVFRALERLFESWNFGAGGGKVSLLRVKGEMQGFRVEEKDDYSSRVPSL